MPACILSCGVLLMLALSCRFPLTKLVGLHIAMLFEWCMQDLPSGHSRGNEAARAGTAQEEAVKWAEQFLRGRGSVLSVACYVLYLCRQAFAVEPHICIAHIRHSTAYMFRTRDL